MSVLFDRTIAFFLENSRFWKAIAVQTASVWIWLT